MGVLPVLRVADDKGGRTKNVKIFGGAADKLPWAQQNMHGKGRIADKSRLRI